MKKRYSLIERHAGSNGDYKISEADSLEWIARKAVRDVLSDRGNNDGFTLFVVDNEQMKIVFHAGVGEIQSAPTPA